MLAAIAGALEFFDCLPAGCVDEVVEPEPEPWDDGDPDPFDDRVDPWLVAWPGIVDVEVAPEPWAPVVVEESLDEGLAVPLADEHPASTSPTETKPTNHFDAYRIRRDAPLVTAQRSFTLTSRRPAD